MKVKMLRRINGAVNGEHMGPYEAGQEYELDGARARLFTDPLNGIAVEVLPPALPIEGDPAPFVLDEPIAIGKAGEE